MFFSYTCLKDSIRNLRVGIDNALSAPLGMSYFCSVWDLLLIVHCHCLDPRTGKKQITQHSSKVNLINDHGLVLYSCAGLPENPAVLFAAVVEEFSLKSEIKA